MICGIFVDLSKTFDTVNYEILIGKLKRYGIRGKALELIKIYLNECKQYIFIPGCGFSPARRLFGLLPKVTLSY